ncbi:DNA-processing protein DprA [Candidatus Omnitrophota bacterium]
MTEREAAIILNAVPEVGSIRAKRLLEYFGSARKVLSASPETLRKVSDINTKVARNIKNYEDYVDVQKELSLVKKRNVKAITFHDKEYPQSLKNIADPPMLLYVAGEIKECDAISIAIVGSRRSSYYGLSMAEKIARELANLGLTVVSGMARGVDSAAHRGSLKCKGRTIAVLGSGLANIYPPENSELFHQIVESGAVISEFPMATKPFAYNFPRRNRIISGLSLGTLVVEASRNSGALITAHFALDQGKEVFALPGKVDSSTSFGTNRLIKQGAKLVSGVEDILEELRPQLKNYLKQQHVADDKKDSLDVFLGLGLDGELKMLYDAISFEPKHIDNIADEAHLDIGKTSSLLMQLELRHLIKQIPGKLFIKNNG